MKNLKGVKSMTGVSTARGKEDRISCRVEIVSLNSKGSELKVMIFPEISGLETKVREFLRKYLKDGKFIVKISFPDTGVKFKLNRKLLEDLNLGKQKDFTFIIDPFKVPGLIEFIYPEKKMFKLLRKVLKKAIESLEEKRIREGREIKGAIEFELDRIKKLLKNIRAEGINEEIVRIYSHLKAIRNILRNKKGPWGRLIDFYGQEILREANTITQKTDVIEIINSAIRVKEGADNIRELSRNLV